MKTTTTLSGILLLAAGLVALLGTLEVLPLSMGILWPVSLLVPGLYYQGVYFSGRERFGEDILIPSVILIVYAVLFFVAGVRGFSILASAWPVFPLAVALGFLQAYFLGSRRTGYLVTGQTLLVFSGIGAVLSLLGIGIESVLFPVILVLVGGAALVRPLLPR